jgi:hypothetical protein
VTGFLLLDQRAGFRHRLVIVEDKPQLQPAPAKVESMFDTVCHSVGRA